MNGVAEDVGLVKQRRPSLAVPYPGWLLTGLLLWLLLYAQTLQSMVEIWLRSETYAHGFLVPAIVLWLVYRRRELLRTIPWRPDALALPFLLLAVFSWALGRSGDALVVEQLSAVAMVPLMLWLMGGRRVVSALLFPLAFLFFMVPVGDELVPVLIDYTARFVVVAIRMSGVPVYVEANHLYLPSGSWQVVEACSGIRYLLASMTLGSLFAYLNYRSWHKRLLFFLASIVVPIVANWLRAYGIVMIGHLSGNRLAVGIDHIIYGWVFFGLMIFLLFSVGVIWHEKEVPVSVPEAFRAIPARMGRGTLASFLLGLLILACAPLWITFQGRGMAGTHPGKLELAVVGWQQEMLPEGSWRPHYLGATEERHLRFSRGAQQFEAHFLRYISGEEGELIGWQNRLVWPSDPDWRLLVEQGYRFPDNADRGQWVNEAVLLRRGGEQRLLVWYWYRIGECETSSRYLAKLLRAFDILLHGRSDGLAVFLATPIQKKDPARQVLAAAVGRLQYRTH